MEGEKATAGAAADGEHPAAVQGDERSDGGTGWWARRPRVAASRVSHLVERGGAYLADRAWVLLRHHPYLGVGLVAGVALGAATVIGPAELALAVGAGYAAYQILRMDVPPSKAIRDAARIEEEIAA